MLATRLTTISVRPIVSRRRCVQISSRASRQAADRLTRFFGCDVVTES
jgi:hypothetical protein